MNDERINKLNEEANRLLDIINDPEETAEAKHTAMVQYKEVQELIRIENSMALDFYKAESEADIKKQKNENDKAKDEAELTIRARESKSRWFQTIVTGCIAGVFTILAAVVGPIIGEIGIPSRAAENLKGSIERSNSKFSK